MTRLDQICYWLSLLSIAFLAHSYSNAIAFSRPIHATVIVLAICAFLIITASKAIPRLFVSARNESVYTALPLNDLSGNGTSGEAKDANVQGYQGRVRISILAAAITTLSLRLELYRQISKKTECTISSVEIYLPILLALYDAFRFQKHQAIGETEKSHGSTLAIIRDGADRYILRPRFRYLLSLLVFCYGCSLLLDQWHPLNSTYICPLVLNQQSTIPWMQRAGLVLDFILAVIICESLPRDDGSGLSPKRSVVLWSSTMLGTAVVWSVVGTVVYTAKPEYRFWLLLLDTQHFFILISSIALHSIVFSVSCITTLHSILAYGFLPMALDLVAVSVGLSSVKYIWTVHQPYPPLSATAATFAFLLLYLGWWSLHHIQHLTGIQERALTRTYLLLVVVLVLVSPVWLKQSSVHFHPIDLLIYEGNRQHEAYFNATQLPSDLASTVSGYKYKYGRNPPPGFDVWWEYATNRSTLILDEYDQINDDLLPFFSIPPVALRKQTWAMVSNPWNEISGITIRDGEAAVQENVLPTHRWMLEGVAVLINSFARYLPDMDLAFNLNDESRVAVPYDDLSMLHTLGRAQQMFGNQSFSPDRKDGWLPIPEEEYHDSVFVAGSFRNTFERWGTIGCPPSSPARTQPYISSQSSICLSCTTPHSLGQFLANWSTAADICHQPDMAHLHGFYLSPAAFKASHHLMPVFSQSKPHGYNDILYPSAWNYMDKVIYAPTDKSSGSPGAEDWRPAFPDPTFHEKYNTLFWRGATSEGVSSGDHTWRGMTRQRLVHLTNNLTSHPHDTQTLLLPDPSNPSKYKYTLIPGSQLPQLGLDTDISIVSNIARCGGIGLHDCTDQAQEFNLVAPTDFQAHWRYRYLMDLDGAGFSGRFLPFLQSRSLPFKSALFREWFDSRIVAWRDFVPVDARLHGLWSTLAYFAGVKGRGEIEASTGLLEDDGTAGTEGSTNGGGSAMGIGMGTGAASAKTMKKQRKGKGWNGPRWEGHIKQGEIIAENGRNWANRVLRKEDMEVYFFRLLLEWGRITDDRRDQLGFDV